jgi:L,D-transpeptidase catalytic domain
VSSSQPSPGDGPSTPRVLAVGAAAAITGLALAGSLGFGPGAAQASSPPPPATATTSTGADSGASAGTSSGTGSHHWLTVDPGTSGSTSSTTQPPATQSPSNQQPGSGSSNPGSTTTSPGSTQAAVPLPAGSGSGRRVVYDISAQRVWLVGGDGSVERTYLVSGPRDEGLIAPSTYHVYSRSRDAISFDHLETMEYMVRFTSGRHSPIGFHDIPVKDTDHSLVQTHSQLGTPLSAGCIRQWEPDAKAMWHFATIHTAVVVVA